MKLFFFLCSYLAFFVMTVTHSEARDVGLGFEPEIGPETIDLSLNNLDQDDPSLIKILRDKYLIKPSKKELNLNNPMSSKTLNGQFGQPFELDEKHFRFEFVIFLTSYLNLPVVNYANTVLSKTMTNHIH